MHALFCFRHESLVMVCGGSGITPFISIIREILFRSTKQKMETPDILLVCAFKNSADLTMLDLLLPILFAPTEISEKLKLQIEAYVTREKGQPNTDYGAQNTTRAVWFKPDPRFPHFCFHWAEQLALARCNNHILICYISSFVGYCYPVLYLPNRSQHR